MNKAIPILYSFRRCPYAMRARLAIVCSGTSVELREILLRNKPEQMLLISPKGTVPVLQLANGAVIDESLDIMFWALSQNDPDNWLDDEIIESATQLIQTNDETFKYYLDRYKYADRYPEQSEVYYRTQAEKFLMDLETRLSTSKHLCSEHYTLADNAIFPFVRQFAYVDIDWFQSSKYENLNQWLHNQLESELFISIMNKYPVWENGDNESIQLL